MINSAKPQKETYRLKYTGTKDRKEFEKACQEHDFWYHSFYFDNGFHIQGDYDIGLDIEQYGFPQDMSGMSVLDVGTGSGWFAAYFEQLGANVTALDARGMSDFDLFGRHQYPDIKEEKARPDKILDDGREVYYSPVSKGFWIMKEILGLKAEYINARIYDISPELFGGKKFDLVFLGSLLMHVRDPIGALMAIRSVCKERIIANTLILDKESAEIEEVPVMMMLANDTNHRINWWQPTKNCVVKWFKAANFPQVTINNTVNLTVDKVYVDEEGTFSGCNQTLYSVDAYVSKERNRDDISLSGITLQPLTTKAKLIEAHQQLAKTDREFSKTYDKLTETHQELDRTHQRLAQTYQQFTDTHQELDRTHQQLAQTQEKLDRTEQKRQIVLERVEHLKQVILAMESSKFWQLRKWWFELKQQLNIGGKKEDSIYQNYLDSIKDANN